MSIEYHIDTARRIVFTKAIAAPTMETLTAYFARLASDPDFDPMFAQLADYADVEPGTFTSDELRRLAEMTPFALEARRAIVVRPGLQYGLARMYQGMVGDPEGFRLLGTRKEALEWLRAVEDAPEESVG